MVYYVSRFTIILKFSTWQVSAKFNWFKLWSDFEQTSFQVVIENDQVNKLHSRAV